MQREEEDDRMGEEGVGSISEVMFDEGFNPSQSLPHTPTQSRSVSAGPSGCTWQYLCRKDMDRGDGKSGALRQEVSHVEAGREQRGDGKSVARGQEVSNRNTGRRQHGGRKSEG